MDLSVGLRVNVTYSFGHQIVVNQPLLHDPDYIGSPIGHMQP